MSNADWFVMSLATLALARSDDGWMSAVSLVLSVACMAYAVTGWLGDKR